MFAHLFYQFTFMQHVCNRTMLIYVFMTSLRTFSQGPISINYVGTCNNLVLQHTTTWTSYEYRVGNGSRLK